MFTSGLMEMAVMIKKEKYIHYQTVFVIVSKALYVLAFTFGENNADSDDSYRVEASTCEGETTSLTCLGINRSTSEPKDQHP